MSNKFCKVPLWECSATLSAVAMGRVPAETVITDAKLVNVCTHEISASTPAPSSPTAPPAFSTTPTRSATSWGSRAST